MVNFDFRQSTKPLCDEELVEPLTVDRIHYPPQLFTSVNLVHAGSITPLPLAEKRVLITVNPPRRAEGPQLVKNSAPPVDHRAVNVARQGSDVAQIHGDASSEDTEGLVLPVRIRPIVTPEQRGPARWRNLAFIGNSFVEVDTKTRSIGGVCVTITPVNLLREQIIREAPWTSGHFLNPHVCGGHAQGDAGSGTNGTKRVVRGDIDVMGLTPMSDLEGFSQPSHDAEIDAGVVDPFTLDHLAEGPFRRPLLAGRDGEGHVPRKGAIAARVFGA